MFTLGTLCLDAGLKDFIATTPTTTQPQHCSWVGHANDRSNPTSTQKLNGSIRKPQINQPLLNIMWPVARGNNTNINNNNNKINNDMIWFSLQKYILYSWFSPGGPLFKGFWDPQPVRVKNWSRLSLTEEASPCFLLYVQCFLCVSDKIPGLSSHSLLILLVCLIY